MRFENEIETIENIFFREFADKLILTIPNYFWTVPASSSGKYHPKFSSGEGGLYRHTQMAFKVLNHILEVTDFTSYEKDMMRIAILMHDTRKCGSQEDYEKNGSTLFEHPVLAGDVIRTFANEYEGANDIARMVDRHMGRWNTSKHSDFVLSIPEYRCEKVVHLADYIASRKDLFDNLNN